VGASADPCRDDYCGEFPFSEPETKSMKELLIKRKNKIVAYFSIHSYSQLWLYPFGEIDKLNPYNTQLVRVYRNLS
jgi:carboxypeptidase A6